MVAPLDYLAIGHVTHDVLSDDTYAIGGTVSYAALTVAALRRSVGILTSAGTDFDFSIFNGSISVSCERAAMTTTFTNTYVNGSRSQRVHGLASPLSGASVPASWRSPRVAHIGPVIGECSPDLITSFSDRTFVGITPQGWMRSQNGEGRVHPHAWCVEEAALHRASAVVFSLDDVQGNWQKAKRIAGLTHLLVVTMGARGGIVFLDGVPNPFPALQVAEVDPTGAGDIFAAALFDTVSSGVPPVQAAHFAACLASRSVARVGPEGVPGSADVEICRGLHLRGDL